jgi:hypothetical protein
MPVPDNVAAAPNVAMAEVDITKWLIHRGKKRVLTIDLARQLARESRLGWYIAPHSHRRYVIGKVTLQKVFSRHIVTDDRGKPLSFDTVEAAKAFLRDELGVFVAQVFYI